MCQRRSQVRYVGEIRVPTQGADAKQNAGAVIHLYEVVEGFSAKQESVRFPGERFKDLK